MSRKVLGAVAAVSVAVCGAAVPASAAAKCAVGKWRLTAENNDFFGEAGEEGFYEGRTTGLAGQIMRISGDRVSFDFAKAKPETTVYTGEIAETYRSTYTGGLKARVKITGSAKGELTPYRKTATGSAKAAVVRLKPVREELGSYRLQKIVREGIHESALPFWYSYTCTRTTLKFTRSNSFQTEEGFVTGTYRLTYKRV
ncbi:hypothetical protein GCM10022221_13800 [Actinocorallia aurea]